MSSLSGGCNRLKTIFVPSGDQRGLKQPTDAGSDRAPPQPGIGIFRSPLPSECTIQIVLRSVPGACAEKRISFPCGDQLPHSKLMKNSSLLGGVISRRSLPSALTLKSAKVVSLARRKTRRLPFGE